MTCLVCASLPSGSPYAYDSTTMELYGPPKVGGDTLSYCGKCKIELAHVIVSMVGTRPAKVICKTCKGQHNYKGAIAANRKSASAAAKPKVPRTLVRAAEYWEQRMAATKNPTRPYSPKETFKVGEVVNHSHFGVGLVEEVKMGGKITVLFRTGDKVLVHGMAPAT